MHKNLSSEQRNLKKAGLKVTVARIKILELFENSAKKHLTADDVYKILVSNDQDVGIATIYRVLTQFEQANILNKHNFSGEQAVFELNSGEHHDHLLCVKCGKVSEFFDETIERRQTKIATDNGFRITDHCMIIYGICDKCNIN